MRQASQNATVKNVMPPTDPLSTCRSTLPFANEVTRRAMPNPAPPFIQRRAHLRRPLQTLTKLVFSGTETPLIALHRDLSWGGASLIVPGALPPEAKTFQLELPWKPDRPVLANARLLRATVLEDGRTQIAVRFSQLTLEHHARLVSLLEPSHPEDEAAPPLASALEFAVNEPAQRHRLLAEIATGRLTLTVFHAYAVDQSIRFSLTGMTPDDGEGLRARIVEVQPVQMADDDWITLYRITLRFEHPLASLKQSVERQLDQPIHLPAFATTPFPLASAPGVNHEGSPA
ncbi:hypothetical protein CCR95_17180 [Thiocystis minor]|nr:hypothetical protein [Thiocystis minor]